jgi:hypothetical protein
MILKSFFLGCDLKFGDFSADDLNPKPDGKSNIRK